MDIPFILLHISTILALALIILVFRLKNKKALHYYFIIAIADLFVWCLLSLIQQYQLKIYDSSPTIMSNSITTFTITLPIFLFLFCYTYSKAATTFKSKLNWLILLPGYQ